MCSPHPGKSTEPDRVRVYRVPGLSLRYQSAYATMRMRMPPVYKTRVGAGEPQSRSSGWDRADRNEKSQQVRDDLHRCPLVCYQGRLVVHTDLLGVQAAGHQLGHRTEPKQLQTIGQSRQSEVCWSRAAPEVHPCVPGSRGDRRWAARIRRWRTMRRADTLSCHMACAYRPAHSSTVGTPRRGGDILGRGRANSW
jgi:hypothetical protein